MATLPRIHSPKRGNNDAILSSPFSTSPRKLQEVTLPSPEVHDSTTSMKQYEEQLNILRKENFHLKLRIYFLEEKLGTGSPPAVQGLLEHNVRLQVEVEELRRQLTDKQELLAAAAEAIDVLEQQGSVSNDSIEMSLNQNAEMKKDICAPPQEDTNKPNETTNYPESESLADYLTTTVNNDEMEELVKLRKDNRKALQMIKGCMKKIQQQDKEIKKIKLDKELVYAHVSDSQLQKYEEIIKCKDKHIRNLEDRISALQKTIENTPNEDSTGDLQQLLTRRLQGLAYFLDKLLLHKCVIGEDKKKLAESILEQSLALPVGLQLDETVAPGELTMDESNLDISHSLRIEDLTLMFGHHVACSDGNHKSGKKMHRNLTQVDAISESECWSEPDRNVSLARIGLGDTGIQSRESTIDISRQRMRRSRFSYGSRSDDNKASNEGALLDEISQLMRRTEILEDEKKDILLKLDVANKQIDDLKNERDRFQASFTTERSTVEELNKKLELAQNKVVIMESEAKDTTQQLIDATRLVEKLREERQELESTHMETERMLRRAADEATVQASQAALDRARAQHERMRVEKELEDTREKLLNLTETNARLQLEVAKKVAVELNNKAAMQECAASEDDRPTSPDQGIDSDRLSSLEHNEGLDLSPRSLYEENVTLKEKLARTKATLSDTLAQLNAANLRKISVQRAICREIHKTHGVLRQARDQFENQNS